MGWTLTVHSWLGRDWTFDKIDAELTEQWGLYADAVSERSVTVDVVWPGNVSLAEQALALGHDLDGAMASISLDGVTHLLGRVSVGGFGANGHPVSLTVTEAPWEDGGKIPGEFDVALRNTMDDVETNAIKQSLISHYRLAPYFPAINAQLDAIEEVISWPNSPPEHHGRVYTIVFGAPGATGDGRPATPAPVLDNTSTNEKLLVCGHKVTVAGNITVWGPTTTSAEFGSQSFTNKVSVEQDGYGRDVTVVDISTPGDLDLNKLNEEFYIEWVGGGAESELTGLAGDVLTHVLAASTLRIDWHRVRAVAEYLNRYQLDGYIDEQVTPWDWVEDNLLPVLPIYPVVGKTGLYFALWDPDLPHVDTLTAGVDFHVERTLTHADVDIANNITLKYGYNPHKDDYTKTAVVGPRNNLYAATSQHLYGERSLVIESDVIDRADTAWRIAHDMARRMAYRPVIMTGVGLDSRFGWHQPGDLVRVTADVFDVTDRLAYVVAISRDGGPTVTLELALIRDPMRV